MNLNDKIAIWATKAFGSMWMFWAFLLMSGVVPFLPFVTGAKDTILYISSGVIQLTALPLLMVGQNLTGRAAEVRDEADHDMILQEFQELKEMHQESRVVLESIRDLIESGKKIQEQAEWLDKRFTKMEALLGISEENES